MKQTKTDKTASGVPETPTTDKAQHSPLPWHISRLDDDERMIRDVQGADMAVVVGATEADAELIVRAVNNAEKLSEALRALHDERDGALQRVRDSEVISNRAFKQRDHYKTHAEKLAEQLRKCLASWANENALTYETVEDSNAALAAYQGFAVANESEEAQS